MYKKSKVLPKIRQGLEDAQCLGVAIRNAGMRSYTCLDNWRKRPLIDRYIKACIDRSETRRINAVVDALFKTAISGNVAACAFYLKNKAGWKDSPFIDQSQHTHLTKVDIKISDDINIPLAQKARIDTTRSAQV